MSTINQARDRAEELLANLQKKAREFLAAEEGLVQSVRVLVEERGLAPAEVKKKLDELIGNLTANKVWERVNLADAKDTLQDYRGEVERRAVDSLQKLLGALPVASKGDVQDLARQVTALNKKLNELSQKLEKN